MVRPRRLASAVLAIGLLGGGTAVFAATGGFKAAASKSSSANSQYCPPKSQQPGKPKKPGPAKCGKSKTKVRMRLGDRTPRRGQHVRFYGTATLKQNGRFVFIQRRGSKGRWHTVAKIRLKGKGTKRSQFSRRILVMRDGQYRARIPASSRSVSGGEPNSGVTRGTSQRKHVVVH